MTLNRETVNEAYKTAMKARDQIAVDTIRLLNSDLKKIEVDERRVLEDKEILAMVQRHIKKRNEAIDAAKSQNRTDIVDKETAELRILEKFLPPQLSEADLIAVIEATIKEVGAATKKEQGKVMSALMPKIQGKADGRLVAKLVGERLA
jgi:uncharacterized protein YqeY